MVVVVPSVLLCRPSWAWPWRAMYTSDMLIIFVGFRCEE